VVHSVFRRVINLEPTDGGLIAVAHATLDDAPRTVRVDRFGELLDRVRVGDAVEAGPAGMRILGPGMTVEIGLDRARRWDTGAPLLAEWDPAALETAAARLERLVHEHGRAGGMLAREASVRLATTPFEAAAAALLADRSATLVAALGRGDRAEASEALSSIVGLGPGLTPAGDDFATGLAYIAAGSTTGLAGFPAILVEVLEARPQTTTPLSLVTMREAARGRVRAHVSDASGVALRTAGDADWLARLSGPVQRVVRIGHTSGTDVLSGVIAGLRLESELRGSM
jgi:hypothetical protein